MLTIFTTPKPFHGHTAVIQRNAIQSWRCLQPKPDIFVFGDADGAAEECARLGVHHVPRVGKNEHGTPLVSAMLADAESLSDSALMCCVNADIVLMADFLSAVQRVRAWREFLMVGRRWDLDIHEPLDFDQPDWAERLRCRVNGEGKLHSVTGIDYFVYSRGLWGEIPPFAVGRSAWDNWLIYRARVLRAPVIDATRVVTAIHQNHGYLHHPDGEMGVWQGLEARQNQELAGGPRYAFTLADATHVLTRSGVRPALSMTHLKRRLVTAALFLPVLGPIINPLVQLARLVRRSRERTVP